MFPEYLEKYEEQQLSEKAVPVQMLPERRQEEMRPLLDKRGKSMREELNRAEARNDVKNPRGQSFPMWGLVLLVSIFGVVMALPLLQL